VIPFQRRKFLSGVLVPPPFLVLSFVFFANKKGREGRWSIPSQGSPDKSDYSFSYSTPVLNEFDLSI